MSRVTKTLQSKEPMAKKELPVLPSPGRTQKPRLKYDCAKCPSYCCSYDWIRVYKLDIKRLAERFGLSYEVAEKKFTKFEPAYGYRVLRHRHDHIFKSVCRFLDAEKRQCTVYEHRPYICRAHPEENTCGYYNFLLWEREHQDDPEFIPLLR
jgi:uncharacterized protein